MRIFMDSNINSMYEEGRTRGLLLGQQQIMHAITIGLI